MNTALSSALDHSGQVSDQASGRLPTLGILRFTGADAASFLQGQLSNDMRRLNQGDQAPLAAFSSPQGRVIAVMTLLPHSSGIIAILPRALLEPTAERLRKFVMRAKVKIDLPGEALCVAGHHGAGALLTAAIAEPPAPQGYAQTDGIGVVRRARLARFYVIGSAADLNARGLDGAENDPQLIDAAWRGAEIRDGLPQVYAQTSEEFVAQMLNLDLLDAISFTKGCYTGQEIIARTQHLGRIKRRMFRLQLPHGAWEIGQTLRLQDGRAGRLVELAQTANATGVEALAVLTLAADDAEQAETGIPASELPLPYVLTAAA